jgi:hypothetical protein
MKIVFMVIFKYFQIFELIFYVVSFFVINETNELDKWTRQMNWLIFQYKWLTCVLFYIFLHFAVINDWNMNHKQNHEFHSGSKVWKMFYQININHIQKQICLNYVYDRIS